MKETIKINTRFAELFGIESALLFGLFFEFGGETKHPNDNKLCFELEISKHELFSSIPFISQKRIENIIESFYRLRLISYGDTETVYNIMIEPNFYNCCKNEGLI